jgi:hypothetical protein
LCSDGAVGAIIRVGEVRRRQRDCNDREHDLYGQRVGILDLRVCRRKWPWFSLALPPRWKASTRKLASPACGRSHIVLKGAAGYLVTAAPLACSSYHGIDCSVFHVFSKGSADARGAGNDRSAATYGTTVEEVRRDASTAVSP